MATLNRAAAAAISLSAILTIHVPASAQQAQPSDESVRQRELATNSALLEGLLERRASVAKAPDSDEARRSYALQFLDSRIAQIKDRSAQ